MFQQNMCNEHIHIAVHTFLAASDKYTSTEIMLRWYFLPGGWFEGMREAMTDDEGAGDADAAAHDDIDVKE